MKVWRKIRGFVNGFECVWKGVPALLSASSVSPPLEGNGLINHQSDG